MKVYVLLSVDLEGCDPVGAFANEADANEHGEEFFPDYRRRHGMAKGYQVEEFELLTEQPTEKLKAW